MHPTRLHEENDKKNDKLKIHRTLKKYLIVISTSYWFEFKPLRGSIDSPIPARASFLLLSESL